MTSTHTHTHNAELRQEVLMQRSAHENEKHPNVSNKAQRLIKHSAARSLRAEEHWRLAPAPGAKQISHQPSNQCSVIDASAWRVRTCVQAFVQRGNVRTTVWGLRLREKLLKYTRIDWTMQTVVTHPPTTGKRTYILCRESEYVDVTLMTWCKTIIITLNPQELLDSSPENISDGLLRPFLW